MSVPHLTTADYVQKVGDYKNVDKWSFKGERPCLVDFYTTWCVYCKNLNPILDDLKKEFAGKVDFYKVDLDKEPKLEEAYNIRTVPTLLLCRADGSYKQMLGTVSKLELKNIIEKELL
ncbi:MAG: thioredoxin domain-containing protein [Parabacteroides sp.]|jgi:thioredoxin|uniref:Thioredoxin domain-containing protein n=1 Tax=bioreactor metagenome TaxID=1076179 RepID=A0A644X4G5_9ZZZZ|nr:thioredoxin domain-containing protein [Parabacteroides sp.]MEA4808051.1 thioredoxin domain-containing protein [Macellibacteroides fermentans]OCW95251.1 thiol reductase thioredoxin [Macellibacteroides sp. HH-ZS]HML70480.1 thioredoxin domain-containing protein [Macellibacteroides fermentans]